jgi:stress response protein YsnF
VYEGDQAVGRVTDLLVDNVALKVRYLEVEPDAGGGMAAGTQVRVPVERVRVSNVTRSVELLGIGAGAEGPSGAFAEFGTEWASQAHETGATPVTDAEHAAARLTRSEEQLHVGTREIQASEVVVQKHVETEHVHEPVATRVERRPATATVAGDPALDDKEIRVPVMSEEVLVEKRPVVKEEIVITKEMDTETTNVEADLRKERVDVRTTGDAQTATDVTEEREPRRAGVAKGGSRG